MSNCKNCQHAIFDEQWGEYKCEARGVRLYVLLESTECSCYKKGEPKESKEKEERQ